MLKQTLSINKKGYSYKVLKAFTQSGVEFAWGSLLTQSEYLSISKDNRKHIQELKQPLFVA